MFNIGDKVRVKKNFAELAEKDEFLLDRVKKEMNNSAGQVFKIVDILYNHCSLVDENGITDGFAWHIGYLDKI